MGGRDRRESTAVCEPLPAWPGRGESASAPWVEWSEKFEAGMTRFRFLSFGAIQALKIEWTEYITYVSR